MLSRDSKGIPLVQLNSTSYSTLDEQKYDQVSQDAGNTGSVQQCNWGVGFITPFFLIAPYILGIAIAFTHLAVFLHLNGKYEGDPRIPSQTHVTAGATIAATIFSFSVRTALAVVFTQYFWRLVRISPLNFGTVETLYTLRSNPLWGFRRAIIREGALLVILACIIWLIPIAATFPPSSMTLESATQVHSNLTGVPTFNAHSTWGGNWSALRSNSLALLSYNEDDGIIPITPDPNGLYTKPAVAQVAFSTIVNGRVQGGPSPCGASCSYYIDIDAPYFSCNETHEPGPRTRQLKEATYSAGWYWGYWSGYRPAMNSSFKFTNLKSDAINYKGNYSGTPLMYFTNQTLVCVVQRGTYEVYQRYMDNQLVSTHKLKSVHSLVDLNAGVQPPAGMSLSQWVHSPNGGDWGPAVTAKVRDANIMTLAASMLSPLIGEYHSNRISCSNESLVPNGEECWWSSVDMEQGVHGWANGTIAHHTPLFVGWNMGLGQGQHLSKSLFNIGEDILNTMLLNVTLATIPHYNLWTTPSNTTQHQPRQKYSFSRPVRLAAPYFVTLGITLPLLILGAWALRTNGVPATDSGFLQILMTTRGSPTVNHIASGGCLGGDPNVPERLRNLPVRFGEVLEGVDVNHGLRKRKLSTGNIDSPSSGSKVHLMPETPSDDDGPRRLPLASFGTPDEVTDIVRGRSYGVIY